MIAFISCRKNGVNGFPDFPKTIEKCEACILAKQHKNYFSRSPWRAHRKLQLIHSDLCGPLVVTSAGSDLSI